MKKAYLVLSIFLIQTSGLYSQHTFSIVAIDPATGEVGSAGATCLDNGASIISGIVPGKGALNAQALVCSPENINLINGLKWIDQGFGPAAVLASLHDNDECGADDNEFRQYGVVTMDGGGQVQASAFTGIKPDSFANHIIGPNYAIQGNILLGQMVLDSMEAGFLNASGTLADKLMAALQGANMVGADTRCAPNGTSSAGAFIRVACPLPQINCSNLNLDVFFLDPGVEPIDTLQSLFDRYFATPPNTAPAHDECASALPVDLAADASSCTMTNVSFSGAHESFVPITHCDKDNGTSDVWYSFTTGTTLPGRGIVLRAEFDNASNPDDVLSAGFALYGSCKADAYYIGGRSSEDGIDSLLVPSKCLAANTEYFLRIWSGESHLWSEGNLRFCVFEQNDLEVPTVVWGDNLGEGDFNNGLNDWTTVGISDPSHVWNWNPNGVNSSLLSSFVRSETMCNGAVGFNNVHYQTGGGFANSFPAGPPYPKMTGELISPVIDLSNVTHPVLRFTQHFAGLNGNGGSGAGNPNTLRGALYASSIDGGQTWNPAVPVNDAIPANEFTSNYHKKQIVIPNVAGEANVRLKFIWDGDFYFWAIDDVKITGDILGGISDQEISPYFRANLLSNPANETISLEFNTDQRFDAIINIYNLDGQVIFTSPAQIRDGAILEYDINAYVNGFYLVKISALGKGSQTLKFLKF